GMKLRKLFTWVGTLTVLALMMGCAALRGYRTEFQAGESVVLVGEQPGCLNFKPLSGRPIAIRSTYRRDLPQTVQYQAGRDYLIDDEGHIRRTSGSRIPDFSTNMLYGKEDFDHSNFPGFGNGKFF